MEKTELETMELEKIYMELEKRYPKDIYDNAEDLKPVLEAIVAKNKEVFLKLEATNKRIDEKVSDISGSIREYNHRLDETTFQQKVNRLQDIRNKDRAILDTLSHSCHALRKEFDDLKLSGLTNASSSSYKVIKELMRITATTHAELANHLSVDRTTVSKVLSNTTNTEEYLPLIEQFLVRKSARLNIDMKRNLDKKFGSDDNASV